jgi:hypothetical protein
MLIKVVFPVSCPWVEGEERCGKKWRTSGSNCVVGRKEGGRVIYWNYDSIIITDSHPTIFFSSP